MVLVENIDNPEVVYTKDFQAEAEMNSTGKQS